MANGTSNDVLKPIAELIVMVGFFVGVGGYFLWYYSGARKTVSLPRATQAAICPSCGAPTAFTPGQVIERCRFCSAAAVAGAALQRAGLDAAEQAARVARLERYRAERRVVAGYANIANSTATIYPWVIGISVGLPMVGLAPFATYGALTGDESVSPGLLGVAWSMSLGVVVAGMVYLIVRSKRRKKWRRVHDQLAAKVNGVTTKGSDAAQHWMDVFWACVGDIRCCCYSTQSDPTECKGAAEGLKCCWQRGSPAMLTMVNCPASRCSTAHATSSVWRGTHSGAMAEGCTQARHRWSKTGWLVYRTKHSS